MGFGVAEQRGDRLESPVTAGVWVSTIRAPWQHNLHSYFSCSRTENKRSEPLHPVPLKEQRRAIPTNMAVRVLKAVFLILMML